MAEKLCELKKKGGGGGKYTETSLWTNSAPTSNFASQSVSLSESMDNFKYIGIKYKRTTTSTDSITVIILVSEFKLATDGSTNYHIGLGGNNTNTYTRRCVYQSNTTIGFANAGRIGTSGTDNSLIIPTEILGLNELEYKPDDYIVTSGTFTIASLNTPVTVTIGFKPKKLTAWRVNATNTFESFTYDDSISTTTYIRLMVASGSNINGGTRNIGQSQTNDLISINDDGFTLASGVATGTWKYFATGVAE